MESQLQNFSTMLDMATVFTILGAAIMVGATLQRVRSASDSIKQLWSVVGELREGLAHVKGELERMK